MITRIKIDGFKSLVDAELYFSPFTCIVGANAIGKSNFFDALAFLSNLADKTLIEAAKSVRSEQQNSNIQDIFFRDGDITYKKMSFEVDMIIPKEGYDDLGQKAYASTTALQYKLELQLNEISEFNEPIQIVHESLKAIPIKEIRKRLYFKRSTAWVNSVISGRKSSDFISTPSDGNIIKLHLDSGGNIEHSTTSEKRKRHGRPMEFKRDKMPRTLLSNVTAESPTAFLVRQEMRDWMMLQLEPTALRRPNTIYEVKNAEINANGANLPATLYRLANDKTDRDIYQEITNQISSLIPDVSEVRIDRDDKRDLLTLQICFRNRLILPAQSLSDGTLRFLGLAILEADNGNNGVICLEEPENGINPKKIGTIITLLQDIATDTNYGVDRDNPLRQVIINTHSTIVASDISCDSLYCADNKEIYSTTLSRKITVTTFSALPKTWRTNNKLASEISLGEIEGYVDGKKGRLSERLAPAIYNNHTQREKTVVDHYQGLLDL